MDIIRNQQKSEFLFNKLSQTRRSQRKYNMTEDFSPKALVVVERLLELLG